jgi:pilus assembly protein CpaB
MTLLKLLPRFKLDRTWALLGVAICIGLIAAFAARSYLSGRVADIEAKTRAETTKIVVAKGDLPRGTRLSTDNLAVRDVPKAYAHSGAVLPEQFGRVDGQLLGHAIKSGEMLMWTQLESRKAPTFSARVEAGRRAVTVPVDEISSISGLLEPGDRVDLIVTLERGGQRQTVPVLQSVQVLATGQRSADDARSGERRMYTTVTLDTDPQQARNLILARESGRLTALLRNPGDAVPMAGVPADFAQWLQPGAAAPARPAAVPAMPVVAAVAAPASRGVPVLYGGRPQSLTPDALAMTFKPADPVAVPGTAPGSVPSTMPTAMPTVTPSAGSAPMPPPAPGLAPALPVAAAQPTR